MPELPDVEKWKRYFDATALNRKVEEVDLRSPEMRSSATGRRLRERLKHASFDRTERRGDYLFAELGKNEWLMLHLDMTSRLACLKDEEPPPKDTGLLVRFADGRRLACAWQQKPGRIGLVDSPDAFMRHEKLGPDPLLPGLTLDRFRGMLRERRGPVKAALMDQHFIAGIGDLYSDEILFQARIHPSVEAQELNATETAALFAAMIRVLHIAIGRSSEPGRLPATWLLPHRGPDGHCPRCNAALQQVALAGGTAFCCPRCQEKSKRHPHARARKGKPRG